MNHPFHSDFMAARIDLPLDELKLRQLFTKPYGVAAPDDQQWRDLYAADVHFEDPTQKRCGINFSTSLRYLPVWLLGCSATVSGVPHLTKHKGSRRETARTLKQR